MAEATLFYLLFGLALAAGFFIGRFSRGSDSFDIQREAMQQGYEQCVNESGTVLWKKTK